MATLVSAGVAWAIADVFEAARIDLPSVTRATPVVYDSLLHMFANLFRV